MRRYPLTWRITVLSAAFVLLAAGGCSKDDPAPTTGGLHIITTGSGRYALYTENLYRTGPALQEGMLQSNGTGKAEVTIDDLNPGSYIFQMGPAGNNYNKSVQVTAGKKRDYYF